MRQKEKDNLVLLSHIRGCTLDMEPAAICGRLNRFATVAQLKGQLTAEFSWEATKRIMNKNQKFSR